MYTAINWIYYSTDHIDLPFLCCSFHCILCILCVCSALFFFFVFLFIPLLFSFLSHILIRLQCIRLVVVFAFQHSCCWDIEQIPVDRHSLELRIDRHWEGIRKITSLPNRGGRERERENTPGFTFVNLWICQIWTVFVSLFSSTKSVCGDARARVSMLCEWQRRLSNGKRCIMIFS